MLSRRAVSSLASCPLARHNGSKCLTGATTARLRHVVRPVEMRTFQPCLYAPFLLPRTFTTSSTLQKKKQKGSSSSSSSSSKDIPGMTPPDPSIASLTNKPEIFNHSKLEKEIATVVDRFKDEASRARTFAGKIDPKIFEELNVELKKSSSNSKDGGVEDDHHNKHSHDKVAAGKAAKKQTEKIKLKELAHVAQKSGKEVMITVHEPRYVDLVSSTVLEILHMNAQHTPTANVLRVEIPPPTTESRQQSAKEVQTIYTSAKAKLDALKRDSHKNFRGMKDKFKQDDIKKAEKETQVMLTKADDEMKKLCEQVKKMIMG